MDQLVRGEVVDNGRGRKRARYLAGTKLGTRRDGGSKLPLATLRCGLGAPPRSTRSGKRRFQMTSPNGLVSSCGVHHEMLCNWTILESTGAAMPVGISPIEFYLALQKGKQTMAPMRLNIRILE